MNKLSMIVAVLVSLAACAMPQQGAMKKRSGGGFFDGLQKPAPQAEQYSVDEVVDIATEPPGARIHVNDAFVGYAPIRTSVRRMWRGEPGRMVLDTVKIEALPVAGGQCVQSAVYGRNSGKTPPQVSFNMTNCAPAAK